MTYARFLIALAYACIICMVAYPLLAFMLVL